MSDAGTLFEQQALNRRRTAWLIAAFVLFFAWLGFGGDFIYALYTAHAPPATQHHVWWFGIVMLGVGGMIAAYAYRTGPEKVLWATGATELVDPRDPAERQLVDVVDEMAIAAGTPRPRIWLVPDADPNAFATGTDPAHAHLAVTQGLLHLCSREELQAVVAHELGHVKNLDVQLMTTLAALVGAVVLIRDGTSRMFWGSGGRVSAGGRAERKSNIGPLVGVLIAVWILSWLLAPIITQLLAMAVSRRREYLADAMSAQFTRNPLALASALHKIDAAALPDTHIKGGAAHMCIADPLGRHLSNHEGALADVLATHPPMAKRIAILKGMGYAQLKREGAARPTDAS
jgi:heat shock protein HtpX